jgi:ketosteroid isomerase-like protein
MNGIPAIVFLATVCLAPVGSAFAHDGDPEKKQETMTLSEAERGVVDFLSAYAEAFASADMRRIEPFFLADERLSYFEGSNVDWGWEGYRKHLAAELPAFSQTSYRITDVRPQVASDLAFATFSWGLDTTVISDQFEGGKHPVNMRGIGTVVLVPDGDRWQIRHMHTAREKAAAPAASGDH